MFARFRKSLGINLELGRLGIDPTLVESEFRISIAELCSTFHLTNEEGATLAYISHRHLSTNPAAASALISAWLASDRVRERWIAPFLKDTSSFAETIGVSASLRLVTSALIDFYRLTESVVRAEAVQNNLYLSNAMYAFEFGMVQYARTRYGIGEEEAGYFFRRLLEELKAVPPEVAATAQARVLQLSKRRFPPIDEGARAMRAFFDARTEEQRLLATEPWRKLFSLLAPIDFSDTSFKTMGAVLAPLKGQKALLSTYEGFRGEHVGFQYSLGYVAGFLDRFQEVHAPEEGRDPLDTLTLLYSDLYHPNRAFGLRDVAAQLARVEEKEFMKGFAAGKRDCQKWLKNRETPFKWFEVLSEQLKDGYEVPFDAF